MTISASGECASGRLPREELAQGEELAQASALFIPR